MSEVSVKKNGFGHGTAERMLSAAVQEFVRRRLTPTARKQHYDNSP